MKYLYIIVPISTIIICQFIKFFVEAIITKKFNIDRLLNGAGGMPSSHSSFVTSLTTIIGLTKGFDSNTPPQWKLLPAMECLASKLLTSASVGGMNFFKDNCTESPIAIVLEPVPLFNPEINSWTLTVLGVVTTDLLPLIQVLAVDDTIWVILAINIP